MRLTKYTIAPMLALALSASGCAAFDPGGKSIFSGGISLTANVTNVTPRMMIDLENTAKVATAGLVAYRRLCIAEKIAQTCRATIEKIQAFTQPLCSAFERRASSTGAPRVVCVEGVLADVRKFVRENDQVNALSAFNLARQLITNIRATRAAAGV